jgi:hypothetical protein
MSNPKSSNPPVPEQLSAIDPTSLSNVTGGTSVAGESNALLGQVNDILGSINSIKGSATSHGLQPQEMMLYMMLLQQRNQAQQPSVVIASPGPSWWGGRWR